MTLWIKLPKFYILIFLAMFLQFYSFFILQENMKLERAYASLQRKIIDNSR